VAALHEECDGGRGTDPVWARHATGFVSRQTAVARGRASLKRRCLRSPCAAATAVPAMGLVSVLIQGVAGRVDGDGSSTTIIAADSVVSGDGEQDLQQ